MIERRRLLLGVLFAAVALTGEAFAQRAPHWASGYIPGAGTSSLGAVSGAGTWDDWFASKADVNLGTLTNPTVTGGTFNAPAISGAPINGGYVIGASTVSSTPIVTHPATGAAFGNSDLTTDTLPAGTSSGLYIGRISQALTAGAGNLGGAGHFIGLFGEATHGGTGTSALAIGSEGVCQTTSTGTVTECDDFVAHMNSNTGTMTVHNGLRIAFDSNTGTVGQHNGIRCDVAAAGNITGQLNCINNLDPAQAIRTAGPIYGSLGTEIVPPSAPTQAAGRFYYGVAAGAVTGAVQNMNTTALWASYLVAGRTSFTKLGFHVTTGQASGACSAAVYNEANDVPTGAPIVTTGSLPATAAGDEEATISVTFQPGLYMLAVTCNNNAIVLASYVEGAAQRLYGGTTSTGGEATPLSLGAITYGTWPTSPPFNYYAGGGNNSPLIWLR